MKYKIWIWLLLIAGSSHTGFSSEPVKATLTQQKVIDVCGSQDKKEFYAVLSIGKVEKSDSLFGFQFDLRYNPDKIKWISTLYTNTLSEFFETRETSFISEEGRIQGYALTFNFNLPPSSGNKPLLVFYGTFLGDCPDTSDIFLDDIEFTEEFTKEVECQDTLTVNAEITDKENRKIEVICDTDSLFFRDDSIKTFNIGFQYDKNSARIENIDYNLIYEKEYFEITDIQETNSKIQILNIQENDSGKRILLEVKDTISGEYVVEFNLKRIINDSLKAELLIDSVRTGDCSCVTRQSGTRIELESFKKDSVTPAVNYIPSTSDINVWYSRDRKRFIIKNEKNMLKFASFYNLMGYRIKEIDNIFDNEIQVDAGSWPDGIYLLAAELKNKKTLKIVLIKE